MVFSSRKTPKPSPAKAPVTVPEKGIRGLLGRKKAPDDDVLPTADISASLTRALRTSKVPKTSVKNHKADKKVALETLESIEAALYSMDMVRDVLQQCFEIAAQARKAEEPAARALLADSYDELRESLDDIAAQTDDAGKVLIGRNAKNIEIEMSGRARYSIIAFPISNNHGGLNLSPPINAFDSDEEINALMAELREAHKRVSRITSDYCRDAKFLIARLEEYSGEEPVSSPAHESPAAATA